MRRRTMLGAVPAAMLAAGCAGPGTAEGPAGSPRRPGTGLELVETFPDGQRHAGPALSGSLLDGSSFDFASLTGKVVVVNFWGSWCAPCRAEAPDLQAASTSARDLGARFLGVDERDGQDAATAFTRSHSITYPSLFDPTGQILARFNDVSPNVIPSTVLIDRQYRVAAVFRRRVTARELEAAVRALATETNP